MPKRKLTSAEKINRYKRKIEEIEKSDQRKRFRRVIIYSDDDSDVEQDTSNGQIFNDQLQIEEVVTESYPEVCGENEDLGQLAEPVADDPMTMPATDPTAPSPAPQAEQSPEPSSTVKPAFDPKLIAALGESTSDCPEFGASIHDTLGNLWLPLLKKGLNKVNKDNLLKEYLIPNNCQLLQAPKLNAEISAAVAESVRGRDKKYVAVQQQLGQGITAINRGMDVMLKSDNKAESLKHLSDACRILSDIHYFFTKDRIKLVIPSLDKNFLHIIQDAERDESLFGNSLSEKIKASKAIEKQGQQIKKTVSSTKTNSTTLARPSTSQGNWSGLLVEQGGRGGVRKQYPAPSSRRAYTSAPPATSRTSLSAKPRVPAQLQ